MNPGALKTVTWFMVHVRSTLHAIKPIHRFIMIPLPSFVARNAWFLIALYRSLDSSLHQRNLSKVIGFWGLSMRDRRWSGLLQHAGQYFSSMSIFQTVAFVADDSRSSLTENVAASHTG